MSRKHAELPVYLTPFEVTMHVFFHSNSLPTEETCSLTDQFRRSTRSVCANIAEADAAETRTGLQSGGACQHLPPGDARALYSSSGEAISQLVRFIRNPVLWISK